MSAHDLSLATDTLARPWRLTRIRNNGSEPEDMPFAVHYDRPKPARQTIWLLVATAACVLLAALV